MNYMNTVLGKARYLKKKKKSFSIVSSSTKVKALALDQQTTECFKYTQIVIEKILRYVPLISKNF